MAVSSLWEFNHFVDAAGVSTFLKAMAHYFQQAAKNICYLIDSY